MGGNEMAKIFYDKDVEIEILKQKKIAIIGFGNQGHAQALNLRDSGMQVIVGELQGSHGWKDAEEHGFSVMSASEAAKEADFIQLLAPDTLQKALYEKEIASNMTTGKILGFSHGFSIHFHQIVPPRHVDVVMTAPKAPGFRVRELYEEGKGTPALVCVKQDYSGKALDYALAYAKGVGYTRAGVIQSTFKEETETDLFGEQAVLWGGLLELVKAGFETLVEAGYQPEIAYFEVFHEMGLVVDLMIRGGISLVNNSISTTAEYGAVTRGKSVINEESRKGMKKILEGIQDGSFATEWLLESQVGNPKLKAMRRQCDDHPLEEVGKRMRAMMSWLNPQE